MRTNKVSVVTSLTMKQEQTSILTWIRVRSHYENNMNLIQCSNGLIKMNLIALEYIQCITFRYLYF